ncbi:ABC transporter substrate-binding protein [Streptomyces sp. NPDC059166]|uniref:ABC transporter substrate-binding protein n=1 Tax=Streptomyces sp. NPDC059166 TaxID=3346752 RepID=UPI0036BC0F9A
MNAAPVNAAGSTVRIGALAPLSPPGWVEAGRHLLAGLELAVKEANAGGGVSGRPLELVVRDTAADPSRAVAAVDELAGSGVTALVGEYHSVVARAAASRAAELSLPFLCSSAVLDALTDEPTDRVARISPPQSRGWRLYADFLLGAGHTRIAVATDPGAYWAAGASVLRDRFAARGGSVAGLDARALTPAGMCDEVVAVGATALLLLTGQPEPAVPLVRAARRDRRLSGLTIGAPAGQPEFAGWERSLGRDGAAIPFLRYLPERLGPLGLRVGAALREHLGEEPSFVAFEGYDTVTVLARMLRTQGVDGVRTAAAWGDVAVDGTRGRIRFSRVPGIGVLQWDGAPVLVVDRDPDRRDRFRTVYAG